MRVFVSVQLKKHRKIQCEPASRLTGNSYFAESRPLSSRQMTILPWALILPWVFIMAVGKIRFCTENPRQNLSSQYTFAKTWVHSILLFSGSVRNRMCGPGKNVRWRHTAPSIVSPYMVTNLFFYCIIFFVKIKLQDISLQSETNRLMADDARKTKYKLIWYRMNGPENKIRCNPVMWVAPVRFFKRRRKNSASRAHLVHLPHIVVLPWRQR
jgi:hypothetical protein